MAVLTLHPASEQAPAHLVVQGDLTIYEARDTQHALLALLQQDPGPWRLDLGAVDDLDSAGLQLLLSLQKTLNEGGPVVALSDKARALVELLNLDTLFAQDKD